MIDIKNATIASLTLSLLAEPALAAIINSLARLAAIVTTFVTELPSVVDSVLTQTALSRRTSPHSLSTHPLWLRAESENR
jgi:hypothetical protein